MAIAGKDSALNHVLTKICIVLIIFCSSFFCFQPDRLQFEIKICIVNEIKTDELCTGHFIHLIVPISQLNAILINVIVYPSYMALIGLSTCPCSTDCQSHTNVMPVIILGYIYGALTHSASIQRASSSVRGSLLIELLISRP